MQSTPTHLREQLRTLLVTETQCEIQEGADGKGWPCGTCLIDLLTRLGLDTGKPEYHERNDMPDRANEVWRAILQIRDATLPDETHPKR